MACGQLQLAQHACARMSRQKAPVRAGGLQRLRQTQSWQGVRPLKMHCTTAALPCPTLPKAPRHGATPNEGESRPTGKKPAAKGLTCFLVGCDF
jgi:hypothetical protein